MINMRGGVLAVERADDSVIVMRATANDPAIGWMVFRRRRRVTHH